MQQTVFDMLIQKIVEAFQANGSNAKLKDVLSDTSSFQKAAEAPDYETGGTAYIGRGMPPSGTPLRERYPVQGQALSELGNNYAPTGPWGATPPDQLDQERKRYEQQSYGLDGLREAFMNEGMAPQIDVGLPSYQGVNIDALNAALHNNRLRNIMGKGPGNQGWR